MCGGQTGHAEVVLVEFDPKKVTYRQLVDRFWKMHDPTQFNRQGPDVGSQYRSAIFYRNDEQRKVAMESKTALEQSKTLSRPIATMIELALPFWMAEDYHQQYYEKNGLAACPNPFAFG